MKKLADGKEGLDGVCMGGFLFWLTINTLHFKLICHNIGTLSFPSNCVK